MRRLKKSLRPKKSLKICYVFNGNDTHFNIVRRQTEMMHQQRVSCCGLRVIEIK